MNESTRIELHPLCTLFPRLSETEMNQLVADIAENGLREPIVIHEGMILDGGNRYRACIAAGVEPVFREFTGGNLVTFVLSANLHRRHLTPGQQAAIVASAQDWAAAQSVGKPKRGNVAPLSSVDDRAAQSGASRRTQKMADAVAKRDPDLAKQVAHGEISLPRAAEQIGAKKTRSATIKSDPLPMATEPEKTPPEPANEPETVCYEPADGLIDELMAENESMGRIIDSDDRLASAYAEVKRLTALVAVQQSRIAGLMSECNAAKSAAKKYKSQYDKLLKTVNRDVSAEDFE